MSTLNYTQNADTNLTDSYIIACIPISISDLPIYFYSGVQKFENYQRLTKSCHITDAIRLQKSEAELLLPRVLRSLRHHKAIIELSPESRYG